MPDDGAPKDVNEHLKECSLGLAYLSEPNQPEQPPRRLEEVKNCRRPECSQNTQNFLHGPTLGRVEDDLCSVTCSGEEQEVVLVSG